MKILILLIIGLILISPVVIIAIIQSKQRAKNGLNKCSICGKTPGTIYFYQKGPITYYHCGEHFDWNHRKPPKNKD